MPCAAPPAAFAAARQAGWPRDPSSSSPCPDAASLPPRPPSPPPSPPSAAAARAMAAARDSFLVVSRSMISFLVSVGTDGAEPSSLRLVRSVMYSRTSRRRKSVRHGLAGEDRLSPVTPVRRMRVFLQELLHVPGSIHQVNQVQVLDLYRFHGALLHIICKAQIHVFAEVGKAVCKTGHN